MFFFFSLLGALIAIVAVIMIIMDAFMEHVLWGIACIFVPLAVLVFCVKNWGQERGKFIIYCIGIALLIIGRLFSPER